jgi:hypothetical protein
MNLTTNQFGSYHLIVDKLKKGRSCPSHTTSKTYPQYKLNTTTYAHKHQEQYPKIFIKITQVQGSWSRMMKNELH